MGATTETDGEIDRLLAVHDRGREALLPLLQDLVRQHGRVSDEAIQLIAERLHLPAVEVLGVASFYSFLHPDRAGQPAATDADGVPTHVVRLCRTLTCELAGAGATAERLRHELARSERTSREGDPVAPVVRLELVHCIGLCDRPPAMLVDDIAVGGVTPERAAEILSRLSR